MRLALLLCQRMLCLQISPALAEVLRGDRVVKALAQNALAGLEYGDAHGEHVAYT